MVHSILIVDDDEVFRVFITHYLESVFNIRVLHAKDGVEALEILKTFEVKAIVTDTNMPNMNGIELLAKVKKENPRVPIIMFFSSLKESSLTSKDVMNMGAHTVLSKEENPKRLFDVLNTIFKS